MMHPPKIHVLGLVFRKKAMFRGEPWSDCWVMRVLTSLEWEGIDAFMADWAVRR